MQLEPQVLARRQIVPKGLFLKTEVVTESSPLLFSPSFRALLLKVSVPPQTAAW